VTIITATLITVAAIDKRIMNREKDFCWLKAMRCAMKDDRFTIKDYYIVVKPIVHKLRLIKREM